MRIAANGLTVRSPAFSQHLFAVPKGKYARFTIPGEKERTIVINKGIKWGAFTYKQDENVLRVAVPSKKSMEFHGKMLPARA